jgi:hypothetical protein
MVKVADSTGEIDRSALRRASELAPDMEIGTTLDDAAIEGQEVVITDYATDEREGDNGPYTLAVFTLEGGVLVHTSSGVVVERMGQIIANHGDDAMPFLATFERVQSKRNPRNRYWTIK